MKPNIPSLPPWYSSQRVSTIAVTLPTTWPSRSARKYSPSACSKYGFFVAVEELLALEAQWGHPLGLVAVQPVRQLDELLHVRLARDGAHGYLTHGAQPTLPT